MYVVSTGHVVSFVQLRSVAFVFGTDSYSVALHNVAFWHTRSLVSVSTSSVYSFNELQLGDTGVHTVSLPGWHTLLANWLSVQTVQLAHTRSEVAVGAAVSYVPSATSFWYSGDWHCVQSRHSVSCVALPARTWYCCDVHVNQDAHTRLDVAVASATMY